MGVASLNLSWPMNTQREKIDENAASILSQTEGIL